MDATHQTSIFSADQMMQFAKAVGLKVSWASFGMLKDLLLKANVIGRGGGGGKASSRSAFSGCAGQVLEIDWHHVLCIRCRP